jgi:phosphate transport system permease protein
MIVTRRKFINSLVLSISCLAAFSGLFILVWILADVALKGYSAINWPFFSQLPAPPGIPGGGLANAIIGTFLMTLTAAFIAVPIGMLAGAYLAEFGDNIFGRVARFLSDILVSAPSIVVGVFVYLVMVKTLGHFSGWAGAVSLAIIMLPVVSRTTEEMLKLVASEMRESALALGSPYWRMMAGVIFRAAGPGIATGVMLAVARVAGETAPLLFTALNSPYWMHSMNEPMANLTVVLFNYAMSPYDDWHVQAWGAALLITMAVLAVNILTRVVLGRRGGHKN